MTFAGKWLSKITAYQHALLWKRCKKTPLYLDTSHRPHG
jgi:hypothetical protein